MENDLFFIVFSRKTANDWCKYVDDDLADQILDHLKEFKNFGIHPELIEFKSPCGILNDFNAIFEFKKNNSIRYLVVRVNYEFYCCLTDSIRAARSLFYGFNKTHISHSRYIEPSLPF